MKKILYIAEALENGVGKHIQDLYLGLFNDKNYKIYVLCGSERCDENILKYIKKENLFVEKGLKRKIDFNDIMSIFRIIKIIKKIKPDIVHCHSSKAGLSGRIAAKLCGIKSVIYSPHAYFFLNYKEKSFKRKLFVFFEKVLSRFFCNLTITTSKGEDDAFLNNKIDNPNKRLLIEHGVNVEKISSQKRNSIRDKYKIKDNEILVGGMARLEKQKDPITMLKIMHTVMEKNPQVRCIIWGQGSLYEEMNRLNDNYNRKIILAGETKEPDKCLGILDIYITSSLYEGLPYTLLESLGLGLPIIATDVEGNRDCVIDEVNGKLFKVKNVEEGSAKLEELIEKKELIKFSIESKKMFSERFSIENMINKYKGVYNKI